MWVKQNYLLWNTSTKIRLTIDIVDDTTVEWDPSKLPETYKFIFFVHTFNNLSKITIINFGIFSNIIVIVFFRPSF